MPTIHSCCFLCLLNLEFQKKKKKLNSGLFLWSGQRTSNENNTYFSQLQLVIRELVKSVSVSWFILGRSVWISACVQTPVMRTERTCCEVLIDDSCAVASLLQSIFARSHLWGVWSQMVHFSLQDYDLNTIELFCVCTCIDKPCRDKNISLNQLQSTNTQIQIGERSRKKKNLEKKVTK